MLKNLKRKAWSRSVHICDNREGETLREWIPHTDLNGVKQAYAEATTWCCISKKKVHLLWSTLPLYVHLLKTCKTQVLKTHQLILRGKWNFR